MMESEAANELTATSVARHAQAACHPPLAVVMVGLPARGKTYIATKLAWYLQWVQVDCKVFNLGDYRRRMLGTQVNAGFFHPNNVDAAEMRKQLAMKALSDMFQWFKQGGLVGILDATNSTRERRQTIYDQCKERGYDVFFVESVCEDDKQINNNILQCKVGLPDYDQRDLAEAIADFKERIEYYRAKYVPLDLQKDARLSFIRLFNVGESFLVHKLSGYIQMRIVRYLMNVHIKSRVIYITRHGESMYNTKKQIGGDPDLSPRGQQYAEKLKEFMDNENLPDLTVWTSSLKRTQQTAAKFEKFQIWKALDELDAGECNGMTYAEIKEKYPEVYAKREQDKFYTRYPRGESYQDIVDRLEPRILELERQENPVLVVCHQAVARCLLAYFQNVKNVEADLPYLKVPLHTVIKVTPIPYGSSITLHPLGVEAVSTHRPQGCSADYVEPMPVAGSS